MVSQLNNLQSQLCPVPTEAPGSIRTKRKPYGLFNQEIDKLQNNPIFCYADDLDFLLAEVEIEWNFVPIVNNVIPQYNSFGRIPRQLGNHDAFSIIRERIALMELAQLRTE